MIEIRKAKKSDAKEAERIFKSARLFMRQNGNYIQWNSVYPSAENVLADAENGVGYVMSEDGKIFAYFAFIIGEDPTYTYIEGKWPSSDTYGTIHRIASDGTHKGVMHWAFLIAGLSILKTVRQGWRSVCFLNQGSLFKRRRTFSAVRKSSAFLMPSC